MCARESGLIDGRKVGSIRGRNPELGARHHPPERSPPSAAAAGAAGAGVAAAGAGVAAAAAGAAGAVAEAAAGVLLVCGRGGRDRRRAAGGTLRPLP